MSWFSSLGHAVGHALGQVVHVAEQVAVPVIEHSIPFFGAFTTIASSLQRTRRGGPTRQSRQLGMSAVMRRRLTARSRRELRRRVR